MKPVFKCDYCDFVDTEDKVREHEPKCMHNYDRHSCYTCKYRDGFKCTNGIEISTDVFYEFCPQYKRKPKSDNPWSDLVDAMFGGK